MRKSTYRNKLLLFWLLACLEISFPRPHCIVIFKLRARSLKIEGAHFIASASGRREPQPRHCNALSPRYIRMKRGIIPFLLEESRVPFNARFVAYTHICPSNGLTIGSTRSCTAHPESLHRHTDNATFEMCCERPYRASTVRVRAMRPGLRDVVCTLCLKKTRHQTLAHNFPKC